ncbi:hypothetical protein DPMN_135553 [Dreissena polymorpha]|uniref:Uncharacterized protein n=1 Tax=Dreissena polymorpha TaxID=45954 RepID=A0A9D4FYD1_DREPO|nr:hypothetical protein DPMN_135553 [Dreissena polymorpha]
MASTLRIRWPPTCIGAVINVIIIHDALSQQSFTELKQVTLSYSNATEDCPINYTPREIMQTNQEVTSPDQETDFEPSLTGGGRGGIMWEGGIMWGGGRGEVGGGGFWGKGGGVGRGEGRGVQYVLKENWGRGGGWVGANRPTNQQTNQQTGQKQYVPHYYSGEHKKELNLRKSN